MLSTNSLFLTKKQVGLLAALLFLMFFVAVSNSYAGVGGEAFEEVWITVKDWTQGTLGRVIAGAMILVGIIGGIARQNLMGFALGIGGGIGLYNAPEIIETIVGATIEGAGAVNATLQLTNGLI